MVEQAHTTDNAPLINNKAHQHHYSGTSTFTHQCSCRDASQLSSRFRNRSSISVLLTDPGSSSVFRTTQIPLDRDQFALGIAHDALTVAAKLRIVARHEDQALQKFAELDTKLRNDPRLSSIHDYGS